jgi:phosphatidylserine/phosphatidylglycerophosphate/cardiolipin synthase-like enzyme
VADDISVFFSPRVAQNPAVRLLNALVAGDDLRVASSHLKGRGARLFQRLARRGVQVTILAEDTHRRVPERVLSDLADAGASIRRIRDPNGLPMHQKFALVDHAGLRSLVFGSFNWTTRSLLLNHEIGAISTDEKLYAAFAERWQALALCAQAGEDAAIVS